MKTIHKNIYIFIISISIFISIVSIACKIETIASPTPTNLPATIEITETFIPQSTNTKESIKYLKIVNCNYLNIRKYGNEYSEILITLPSDTKLEFISKDENNELWYKVKYNSIIGFVNSNYILPLDSTTIK